MTAITTMCSNNSCRARRGCLRHEATPKRFGQIVEEYAPDSEGRCRDFVPLSTKKYLGKTTAA